MKLYLIKLKVLCIKSWIIYVEVTRPVVLAVICVGLFIIIDTLVPKTMAMRTSNVNNYRIQDQRTHNRRNYIVQRDNEISRNLDNVAFSYDSDLLESGRSPEDLPAFFVDYANMFDDVIVKDKSVETRSSKRGNIKLEKHNQLLPDPPCKCETNWQLKELGRDTFPRRVQISVCDNESQGCVAPYKCQEIYYDMPILRKRVSKNEFSLHYLVPQNLNTSWVAGLQQVSVGCECQRDYKGTLST